jgi:hypothetical protein
MTNDVGASLVLEVPGRLVGQLYKSLGRLHRTFPDAVFTTGTC